MKTEDIRDLTAVEIDEQIVQASEELFRLRFRSATQELENPSLIRMLRRDIARMKTVLRERESENE
ncbi:MAG TPA: 50S ribosomal protein L29 [Longimicrobiales bacterium]|nr:50S ribosomal protein L29 [Longimicrobiales bacterium]